MKSIIHSLIPILCSILLFTNCTQEANLFVDTPSTESIESKSRSSSPIIQDFKEYIRREMRKQHIPALSILIFEEDEVLYEDFFGKAQIQSNRNLQKEDVFLLASVSKVITATALLQLYDKKQFSLDDNINNYLNFQVANPYHNTPITFRMLLTHTSAIADGPALDEQYYYGKDSPIKLADFLADYLSSSGSLYNPTENFYEFKPGSDYEYSNIGNALIGLLVEEISGMDFSEYCQQYIFNPLGMKHTAWHLSDINGFIVQPYDYFRGRYEAIEHYTFTDYPNGGLRSTARDLFQFFQAFVQRGRSQNYQLLKFSTVKAMTTFQIPHINEETGLHLFQLDQEDNLWGHDGGEQGVSTIVAFNPNTKIGAIILTNQGEADLDDILIEAYLTGYELE